MTEIPNDLLESARSTRACMADVRSLAERISDLPTHRVEPWLQQLPDSGEDRALSRLLQAPRTGGLCSLPLLPLAEIRTSRQSPG